jgi:hypothetical protein
MSRQTTLVNKAKIPVEIFIRPERKLSDQEAKFEKWKRRVFLKPKRPSLIFNSIKTCGFLATCGLVVNLLFFWDFGQKEHIFTTCRERVGRHIEKKYFTLTDQEREYLRAKDLSRNQNLQ